MNSLSPVDPMEKSKLGPRARATTDAILSAAEALFLEKLYADVSMRELAQRAGVTTGALYYHFPSKAELYFEMLRNDFARKKRLLEAVVGEELSAYENLKQLLIAFVTIPPEKRDLMHLVRRDINAFRDPMRREIIEMYQQSLPDILTAVVQRGIDRGEFKAQDATLLARQLIALLEVALAPYGVRKLGGERAVVEQVMGMFWQGAGRGSSQRSAAAEQELEPAAAAEAEAAADSQTRYDRL